MVTASIKLRDENDREYKVRVDGNTTRHDELEDVEIIEAYYTDNGEEVPDSILVNFLEENEDAVFEAIRENEIDQGIMYERAMDRYTNYE